MVSSDSQWHLKRRQEALKKNPDLAKLDGVCPYSAPIIVALVFVQWGLWVFVNQLESYLLIGCLAWLNATTTLYMLTTFIHENSHGLILGWKNRLAAACLIEAGFPSFGEQWEYTVVHYAMHHPSLNDGKKDSECPGPGHVAVNPEGFMRYVISAVELLPLGTLLAQGQLSNNAQHGSTKRDNTPQMVLMGVSAAVYGTLIYLRMWHAVLFAAWSASLYASRWCIALHGQSIAEHYRHKLEPSKDIPPTHSTYYFWENLLGFNTGYHDEHHTFPNVSWYNLPELKRRCPDVFKHENKRHYTDLWWEWASHGFETTRFRMCHD